MRIGHYLEGLGIAGGVQSYVKRISAAQKDAGHDVVVFDQMAANRRVEGAVSVQTAGEMIRCAEERGVDVLHLHNAIAPVATSLRLVRTMHGHQPYCPSGARYLKRPGAACNRAYSLVGCTWGHLVNRCGSIRPLQFVDDFRRTQIERNQPPQAHVLANSEFVRHEMIRSDFPSERVTTVYLPVPATSPEPEPLASGPPMFLFMGRIVENKGLHWVVRALADTRAEIRLEVAGSGPQLDRIQALARMLNVERRVQFHGWLPEAKVFERITASRAIIFPSLWHEPAGLVSLEAAAHARALIASRVGGIAEYAAQLGHAILLEPYDVGGLSHAMETLAQDADLAACLGRMGHRHAQGDLNMSGHLRRLEQAYRGQPIDAPPAVPVVSDQDPMPARNHPS